MRERYNASMPTFISQETAVEVYRTLSRDISHDEMQNAKTWYASAKCHAYAISFAMSIPMENAASIISAFSPRVKWTRNMALAWQYATGQDVKCLGNSIRAAERAKGCGFSALKGLKTNAFARNIAGDLDAVTIDAWMLRPFGLKAVNKTNYRTLSNAIRTVAREVNMTPADLQALIWVRLRGKSE
jgi:hypothetical protein